MKIHSVIVFEPYDRSEAPKGEQFDEQLTSELENIEIEGYNTMGAFVARSKGELEKDESLDALWSIADSAYLFKMKQLVPLVEAGRGNEVINNPPEDRPEFTIAQDLAFQAERLVALIEMAVKERKEKEEAKRQKRESKRASRIGG